MATLHMALPFFVDAGIAQDNLKNRPARPSTNRQVGPTESELTRARSDVIQKIKETRAGAEKLLTLHESERQRALERYEQQRDLYYQGLIARNDVLKAEDALAQALVRINEDKRWLAETDMVITEATMRDELLRLPGLAVGGYSETAALLRFNGGALWSLAVSSRAATKARAPPKPVTLPRHEGRRLVFGRHRIWAMAVISVFSLFVLSILWFCELRSSSVRFVVVHS